MQGQLGGIEENLKFLNKDMLEVQTNMEEVARKTELEQKKNEQRLGRLEEDIRRLSFARMKQNRMQAMNLDEEEMEKDQTNNQPDRKKERNVRIQPAGRSEPRFQSSWAQELNDQLNADGSKEENGCDRKEPCFNEDLSPVAERGSTVRDRRHPAAGHKMPKKSSRREVSKKQIKVFGNDENEEEDTSMDDTDSAPDDEKEGWSKTERKMKNEEKKRRRKDKKIRIQKETAIKATKIVGVGPIEKKRIEEINKKEKNFEKAK